jgi:hypothetical protein
MKRKRQFLFPIGIAKQNRMRTRKESIPKILEATIEHKRRPRNPLVKGEGIVWLCVAQRHDISAHSICVSQKSAFLFDCEVVCRRKLDSDRSRFMWEARALARRVTA